MAPGTFDINFPDSGCTLQILFREQLPLASKPVQYLFVRLWPYAKDLYRERLSFAWHPVPLISIFRTVAVRYRFYSENSSHSPLNQYNIYLSDCGCTLEIYTENSSPSPFNLCDSHLPDSGFTLEIYTENSSPSRRNRYWYL